MGYADTFAFAGLENCGCFGRGDGEGGALVFAWGYCAGGVGEGEDFVVWGLGCGGVGGEDLFVVG